MVEAQLLVALFADEDFTEAQRQEAEDFDGQAGERQEERW